MMMVLLRIRMCHCLIPNMLLQIISYIQIKSTLHPAPYPSRITLAQKELDQHFGLTIHEPTSSCAAEKLILICSGRDPLFGGTYSFSWWTANRMKINIPRLKNFAQHTTGAWPQDTSLGHAQEETRVWAANCKWNTN